MDPRDAGEQAIEGLGRFLLEAGFAGTTKYPLMKMIGFAADALISFSMVPLRIATYVGALLTTGLTLIGIFAVISWILSGTVPGWTSLTLLVVMISSVQLLVLGLIGEYVGRIYIQSKNRPLFLISHIHRRGRLPHSATDGRDDLETVPLMTLLAQSESNKRSELYEETS